MLFHNSPSAMRVHLGGRWVAGILGTGPRSFWRTAEASPCPGRPATGRVASNHDMNWNFNRSVWGRLLPAWAIGLALGLGGGRVFAVDSERSDCHYNCRTWRRDNGLPANAINTIAPTSDGYLWLGTSKGLARFDGEDICPVYEDSRGRIWLGGHAGAFERRLACPAIAAGAAGLESDLHERLQPGNRRAESSARSGRQFHVQTSPRPTPGENGPCWFRQPNLEMNV